MPDYQISWTIDLTARNPLEAARLALHIHRDPNSIATVFEVCDVNDTGMTFRVDPTEETVALMGPNGELIPLDPIP